MGYVFGTQWTDDMVQAKILDCVSALGLKRMPSRADFHNFYGSDALTNRIRRSGGYYDWADRLGLPMKESETHTGKDGEAIAKELLEQHGFTVKRMSTRYPYDLYVNGCVKVDVKTAHQTKTANIAKCYSFGLSKKVPNMRRVFPYCAFRKREQGVHRPIFYQSNPDLHGRSKNSLRKIS